MLILFESRYTLTQTAPKSSKILLLVSPDVDGFSTPQYIPANRACSHVYQIHQTPPAAFAGFRTVHSQAMDALHLLLYQIHQTPPAAFVGFRTVYIAKPWMLCICHCTNSIEVQQLGYLFTTCWWILADFRWFLAKMPRALGLKKM